MISKSMLCPRKIRGFILACGGPGGRQYADGARLRLPNGGRSAIWVMRDHERWPANAKAQIIDCRLAQ